MPLNHRNFQGYYMPQSIATEAQVEYWDLSLLFFDSTFEQEDASDLVKTIKFKSYRELKRSLKELLGERVLIVTTITFEPRLRRLYALLNKFDVTLLAFGRNQLPVPTQSGLKRIGHLTPKRIKQLVNRIVFEVYKKMGWMKNHDVIFYDGDLGWRGVGCITKEELNKAQVVRINSNDYDSYLEICRTVSEPMVKGRYILFLDEYLPLHPDIPMLGFKNVELELYYGPLNEYFTRLERRFSMAVIIAAHPKALRYKTENFFEGRQVVFGKTGELCRDAEFVMTHDSTSLNFAIMFNKRLHLLTSKMIEERLHFVHKDVLLYEKYMGCSYQYVDNDDEALNVVEQVDKEAYERYKYEYMFSNQTKSKYSMDIFREFIEG